MINKTLIGMFFFIASIGMFFSEKTSGVALFVMSFSMGFVFASAKVGENKNESERPSMPKM